MVGVAGKSKACINCKRRRVKCGLERPGCLRCEKARTKCLGYGQQRLFVNMVADPSVSKSSPSRLQDHGNGTNDSESDSFGTLTHLIALANSPAMSPRSFRQQAFRLIKKLYLPQPQVVGGSLTGNVIPNTWFGAVCDLDGPCVVLDHALIAFCAIQMHVTNTENVSRDQGIEHYNSTLAQLSAALSHGEDIQIDYILASLVVLSTCEIFCFPTDDGLRVHIQGISDIMRFQHGSTDVSPTTWTKLWSRLRVISVLSHLTGGPPSSVTVAQWVSVRRTQNANLDPIDQLMDIVDDLPRILDLIRDAFRKRSFAESDFTSTITALWHILRDIYSWQAILYTNTAIPAYTVKPSGVHNISDEAYDSKLFPLSLDFSSFSSAILLISSWAMQLQILIHIQRISEVCEEATVVPTQFQYLHGSFGNFRREGTKLAHLLCQSIEYSHRIEVGTFGFQILVYPGWVVRQFYEFAGMERELRWCQYVNDMSGTGIRAGMQLMKFRGTIGI
ncbi:hypothetical protein DM02DRAFT_585902 [Periconia macrospinosa]|uniref:Zn(2)-C6 fungal-type domain-containing protein n=1 Tax=Periconia macrospinosa TaxID=97972 RepID=A0A2V1E226_9PLEO|nr:hypothetical protein DM02DRAFT_585902 [Periconia macrospinosa]